MTFTDVLSSIREQSLTEKEKGTQFEQLMKRWLKTDPRYSALTDVWLWEEFPAKQDLGGRDLGIDLVARTDIGEYWAIQCKCYAENARIDKPALDSFLANASRCFMDVDTMQTCTFDRLLWIDTTRSGWGSNAMEAIKGLSVGFNRINLSELEHSDVDWSKLQKGEVGDDARLPGKRPLPHQILAIEKASKYFIEDGNDRGKLIMACGTGKTYTSLQIMEQLTDPNALVLFLVPSIALLGQTLNAWMPDRRDPMRAICVCSDSSVSKNMKESDSVDESVTDLALPATTNQQSILRQLELYSKKNCRTVIFSTYQSIDAVSAAILKSGRTVDLCICDEAHRTTGVKIAGNDESAFTKVHDNAI
ncbi:MAG: DEAD/DEAH box helicase family protein, partial [Parabacteroides sp.]|nr:DEAD/DEAH box helicase family protein [Parabacteroides sp.]